MMDNIRMGLAQAMSPGRQTFDDLRDQFDAQSQGPERDLSWVYVAIDRYRVGSILDAAPGFFDTDLFPSTDADECGVFIPAELRARPGLYKITDVRIGGSSGPDIMGEWDGPEISGTWTPLYQITSPNS